MLAKEAAATVAAAAEFDLPEEMLEVLPADPFEQLDVARKITSIALSSRVSALESDAASLRNSLSDKDRLIAELHSRLHSLESSLSHASDQLSHAQHEKESLLKENASLSSAVKKLSRDVFKLEAFRKTLMQSLQEDAAGTAEHTKQMPTHMHLSLASAATEEDATLPRSRASSIQSRSSEAGNSFSGDHDSEAMGPGISQNLLLASQASTPRFTPPGSPPNLSAAVSPTKTSNPVSPRRRSASFTTKRGMFDDRSSIYSPLTSSLPSSTSSSDSGSQTGRARVDGKEFFRQVRSRLSYEQFGAFLTNVKELNSHNQTREETLVKAKEIFGPENKDLYAAFERLIARNAH